MALVVPVALPCTPRGYGRGRWRRAAGRVGSPHGAAGQLHQPHRRHSPATRRRRCRVPPCGAALPWAGRLQRARRPEHQRRRFVGPLGVCRGLCRVSGWAFPGRAAAPRRFGPSLLCRWSGSPFGRSVACRVVPSLSRYSRRAIPRFTSMDSKPSEAASSRGFAPSTIISVTPSVTAGAVSRVLRPL